jgi:DNA-binding MarR family transcriptional regulator
MPNQRSIDTTRRVWAALTATPDASIRELATRLGIAISTVASHRRRLREAGYIAFEDGGVRATRVLVPLYVQQGKTVGG